MCRSWTLPFSCVCVSDYIIALGLSLYRLLLLFGWLIFRPWTFGFWNNVCTFYLLFRQCTWLQSIHLIIFCVSVCACASASSCATKSSHHEYEIEWEGNKKKKLLNILFVCSIVCVLILYHGSQSFGFSECGTVAECKNWASSMRQCDYG